FFPAGLHDHACSHCFIGILIHQNEATRIAVAAVTVKNQTPHGAQAYPGNIVHGKIPPVFYALQGIDIHFVDHIPDYRAGFIGGVPDDVFGTRLRSTGIQPANHHVDVLLHLRLIVFLDNHVAAANVDVVFQGHRNRHRRKRFLDGALYRVYAPDRGGQSRRRHTDRVARPETPASDASGVTPVVVILVRVWTDDGLHRETRVNVVFVASDVNGFQRIQQGATLVPVHVFGALHDVIPV